MKALMIAATVGLAMFGAQAKADHSLASPKGEQLFGHKVTGVSGANVANTAPIGPAAKAPTSRERMATGSSASDPDLVRSGAYTGRNPFGTRGREFEIAPLSKGKAKECEPGCTKPCCAKK